MPSQLVLGQWVSLYVAVRFVLCVCVKFSKLQNFNKRVKPLPLVILYCLLGSTFCCCKILCTTPSPKHG